MGSWIGPLVVNEKFVFFYKKKTAPNYCHRKFTKAYLINLVSVPILTKIWDNYAEVNF